MRRNTCKYCQAKTHCKDMCQYCKDKMAVIKRIKAMFN